MSMHSKKAFAFLLRRVAVIVSLMSSRDQMAPKS